MESVSFAMVLAMITSSQCRAARGLLDWTQQELADRAGVGIVTVRQFEGGLNEPRRATLEVIRGALEAAGVEFIQQNCLGFIEGCIIKYLCRYKKKHADPRLQLVDLKKAQHYLEMLVEMTAAVK